MLLQICSGNRSTSQAMTRVSGSMDSLRISSGLLLGAVMGNSVQPNLRQGMKEKKLIDGKTLKSQFQNL